MTQLELEAEKAWEVYVAEARKRAKMEGDPNFSPAEKIRQQQRVDAAFRIFRRAFALLDAAPPTAPSDPIPSLLRRLVASIAALLPRRANEETSR